MSLEEKFDQAKGAVKEGIGKVTGDKKTEFEGAAEKTTAKVKDVAEDVKDAAEEKVDQAKDALKEGADKITGDKKLVVISIVSSIVSALVVGFVISLFFVKKTKKSIFNRKHAMKIIDKIL